MSKPKSIMDFYAEAAEKQGAVGIREAIKHADRHCKRDGGANYCIDYTWGDDSENMLSVYGSGVWDCDTGGKHYEGKLPPPHAKSWTARLVRNGVAPDFARVEQGQYYGFRHGLNDEP